jgi:hypothetical protein
MPKNGALARPDHPISFSFLTLQLAPFSHNRFFEMGARFFDRARSDLISMSSYSDRRVYVRSPELVREILAKHKHTLTKPTEMYAQHHVPITRVCPSRLIFVCLHDPSSTGTRFWTFWAVTW